MHRFKFGDIIYLKAFINWDYELGQIMRYDEEKGMYVVIRYLDNLDPFKFWRWCYIKEDEMDFASKVLGDISDTSYCKQLFPENIKLTSKDYLELYDEEYDLYVKLMRDEITTEEFYRRYRELHSSK